MVGLLGAIVPASGHLPLMPRFTRGTGKKVYNFDFGIKVCLLEKPAYMTNDFADSSIVLS